MSQIDVFGRLLPALAVVAAIPLGVLWWNRRRRGAGREWIRVTARTPIGKNAWVAVLEIDGRRFLVGSADRAINLIAELDGATVLEDEMVPSGFGGDDDGPRMGLIRRMQERTLRRAEELDPGSRLEISI